MAIAEVELNTITRSIRGAMGESAGQFRQAAEASSANLTKIVKDLANTFAAQKRDMAEVANSIEESVHESQQTSNRIDNLTSLMQESITIQSQMAGSIKTVAQNIKILNDSTESFNRNVGNMLMGQGGSGGILGALTGGFNNVTSTLTTMAIAGAGAGLTMGAGAMMGGATTDSSVGKGSQQFQSVAPRLMKDLQRDFPGLSKEDAAAIIGNLGEESGGFGQMKEAGGAGPGRGWAQWTTEDRRNKFLANVSKHGGDIANYDANYETLRNELKGDYASSLRAVMSAQGLEEGKTRAFRATFERPKAGFEHDDVRIRYAQRAINASDGSTTADATPATSTQKPEVFQQGPVASESASRTDTGLTPHHISGGHGGEGHGSGKLSGVNQAILDKFNQIQSSAGTPLTVTSGFRDPAHNAAVGGAKNSAHTRGNAVDVTFAGGIPETLKMIEAASKAGVGGIGVYRPGVLHFDTEGKRAWGPSYHLDSVPDWAKETIFKHLGAAGGGKTPDAEPSATTPSTTAQMQQMQIAASTGGLGTQQGAPAAAAVEQPHISQAMAPASGAPSATEMMGMMSMMGAIPGMGGISGMLPMVASVAGLLQGLSSTMSNVDLVNQAAVSQQAQAESFSDTMFGDREPQNTPSSSASNIQMSSTGEAYAYNNPGDTGWPDWAAMIGGNHWEEMKNYKKNMWG